MACHKKPQICSKYDLHKRHGQFYDFQNLMFDLKMLTIYSDSFIFF